MKRILNVLTRLSRSLSGEIRRRWAITTQSNVIIPPTAMLRQHASIRSFGSGSVTIGENTALSRFVLVEAKNALIQIGSGVHISQGVVIAAQDRIDIGDNCQIAEYVSIRDQDHVFEAPGPLARSGFTASPIVIGQNVWIGARASVARGVAIGDNAVIGAGAVVTSDIPANSVAVGVPARVFRSFDKRS